MLEHFELLLRWILGTQLVFWGLNGFFDWKSIPPSSAMIEKFTEACVETRFIMPTVKLFEIIFGAFLLGNIATPLALAALAPLMFVISVLHLFSNKKWWEVVLPLTLPFVILIILHLGFLGATRSKIDLLD